MALREEDDFEKQHAVIATGETDVFTNKYPAWHHPHAKVVNGAYTLSQSALSAYKTVPSGFVLYTVQAQLMKAAVVGLPLRYEVQRISTTSRTAWRLVQVKQEGTTRVMVTLSFMLPSKEDKLPQPFDWIPKPSRDTLEAAAKPIDPELDDADQGPPGSNSRAPKWWPKSRPYPAVSNQRQSISRDPDISKRIYRCKLRVLTPLSSPTVQIIATLFYSDFYVLDTPITVQGIPYGIYSVGDRTKTTTTSPLKNFATLNHTLHFCAADGWDVHEGLLLECVTVWAKGRRAVVNFTMRDTKGRLVATGEQEGYFLFKENGTSERSKM